MTGVQTCALPIFDGGRENIPQNNAVELYNLAADIGEINNLSAIETGKLNELLDELIKWQQETNAPIPTEMNPEYGGRHKKMVK